MADMSSLAWWRHCSAREDFVVHHVIVMDTYIYIYFFVLHIEMALCCQRHAIGYCAIRLHLRS
jgi:hypothetical protein